MQSKYAECTCYFLNVFKGRIGFCEENELSYFRRCQTSETEDRRLHTLHSCLNLFVFKLLHISSVVLQV